MAHYHPRSCWRCGGLHVGLCAKRDNAPSRDQMEARLNAFVHGYADAMEERGDSAKAVRVRSLSIPPRGLYS